MSYVKTIVEEAVTAISPDSDFILARNWEAHVNANQLESTSFPAYILDNITNIWSSEISSNYTYPIYHNFILTCIDKIDNHSNDDDKESTIDSMVSNLRDVAGEIYKNLEIQNGLNNPTINITPIPEIFSGYYAGAALQMVIPEYKTISACE